MKLATPLAKGLLALAALGLLAALEVSHAQSAVPDTARSQAAAGVRPVRLFLRALKELNLSQEQKQQIKTLVGNARQSMQAQPPIDMSVLANPADPNYASTLASAKARAALRIQQWSDVQQQIYQLLTPEQQAQLPQLLSSMHPLRTPRAASAS